jgi:hypothetical protein
LGSIEKPKLDDIRKEYIIGRLGDIRIDETVSEVEKASPMNFNYVNKQHEDVSSNVDMS